MGFIGDKTPMPVTEVYAVIDTLTYIRTHGRNTTRLEYELVFTQM